MKNMTRVTQMYNTTRNNNSDEICRQIAAVFYYFPSQLYHDSR